MASRRHFIKSAGIACLGALYDPAFLSAKETHAMLKRSIPSTGEKLPVVGLGTWAQFDVGGSESERQPLRDVLKQMADLGGTLIDSSPMYGTAEQVVGDVAADVGLAERFFYATKVWTNGRDAGITQMKSSFTKMRRSKMDLMQIHNLVDWKMHLKTLRQWKEEGKIRYIGLTHYTVEAHEELERIILSESLDFVQFNYSIRVRNAEKSLLRTASDKGVAVIINEPFEKGSLFGAVKNKKLPEWAAEWDIASWGQFFLKFILSHQAVNCVIPGTSNPKHVLDNMTAGYGRLPDESGRDKMALFMDSL